MRKTFLFITLALSLSVTAQSVYVTSCREVAAGYYPELNSTASQMTFSTESHQGLTLMQMADQTKTVLSQDVCMEALFSADDQHVFYRVREMENNRMFQTVRSYHITAAQRQDLITRRRGINALQKFDNGVLFSCEEQLRKSTFGKSKAPIEAYVSNEDLKLVLYINGHRMELNPYKEAELNYVWASLSPDKSKIVFTTKYGTAVCNLQGQLIASLGKLNAPRWWDNNTLVGMVTKNDGYFFTSASIRMVSLDKRIDTMLTNSEMGICMYPSVAPQVGKIAFNTLDGKIYVMDVKISK